MALAQQRDEYLFDADSHVLEPPDMWDNYLEPAFRHRGIRITPDARGVDQLWVDAEVIMPNRLAAIGQQHSFAAIKRQSLTPTIILLQSGCEIYPVFPCDPRAP